jgi:hypothetical protein
VRRLAWLGRDAGNVAFERYGVAIGTALGCHVPGSGLARAPVVQAAQETVGAKTLPTTDTRFTRNRIRAELHAGHGSRLFPLSPNLCAQRPHAAQAQTLADERWRSKT